MLNRSICIDGCKTLDFCGDEHSSHGLLVMTPCSDVAGYQFYRGPCCFHLQGEVNGTGKRGTDTGKEYNTG